MRREELIRELRMIEDNIMNELNSLGFKTVYDKDKNRKTNSLMGSINDRFNKGFYGYTTKTIKEKLEINSYDSLIRHLSNKHLEYRIDSFNKIKNKLSEIKNNYVSDKKELILDIAYYEGVNNKKNFTGEYGITPFTSLKKDNPKDALKLYIYDKYNKLDNCSKEDLINGILDISFKLREKLPKHFSYDKAYGKAIGELTSGMYGLTSKEIKDSYRKNNIKIPGDNILYLMNEEHLKYRIICLYIINNYSNMYNKNEYDLFINKCKLIGNISKELFMEFNGERPYYNLFKLSKSIKNVKISKNVTKENYKLSRESSVVFGEQISLFDVQVRRIKDFIED